MRRCALRLVSCLSLVAYLLANTHLNLAIAWCAHSSPGKSESRNPSDGPKPTSKCKHCSQSTDPVTESKNSKPSQPKPHDPNCPGCPECPIGPNCPCCPAGGDHSCPVPGGCAMCSVAMAPWLGPLPSIDSCVPPVFEFVAEYTSTYLPPVCDGLIRPPRA